MLRWLAVSMILGGCGAYDIPDRIVIHAPNGVQAGGARLLAPAGERVRCARRYVLAAAAWQPCPAELAPGEWNVAVGNATTHATVPNARVDLRITRPTRTNVALHGGLVAGSVLMGVATVSTLGMLLADGRDQPNRDVVNGFAAATAIGLGSAAVTFAISGVLAFRVGAGKLEVVPR